MFLKISGYLKDDSEDDTIKFKHVFENLMDESVLRAMGWSSMESSPDGEIELSLDEIQKIEDATGIKLPSELCLFLGVRSGSPMDLN